MGVLHEFRAFLDEYKVMGLAVAFIIGAALTALVQSLVNDIIMPAVSPLMHGGDWKTAVLQIGPVSLKWGSFAGALINFVIVAFVVFMIAKFALKEPTVTKK